ncbi:hypothetical protein [uncultured Halomonas sp.]|nr:hypothetical protein [uncultured Halomonas sp.]
MPTIDTIWVCEDCQPVIASGDYTGVWNFFSPLDVLIDLEVVE